MGLRWWSQIKEDGSEEWIYESMSGDRKANSVDSTIFWLVAYATPIVWLVFAIMQVISLNLNYFFMCFVGFLLPGINLINYIRCQKNHTAMMRGWMFQKAQENITPAQMAKLAGAAAKQTL